MNQNQLQEFQHRKRRLEVEEGLMLQNWLQSNDPDLIIKAEMHLQNLQKKSEVEMKTTLFDETLLNSGNGYVEKNSALSFSALRSMASVPIISAIIKTRTDQISEFTTPQRDKFSPGFIIRKKSHSYFSEVDVKDEITPDLQKRIDNMTEFILNCGEQDTIWGGDTFNSLTRKIIPDSLTLDQATFEIIRNRKGIPIEVMATDGASMRIADGMYSEDKGAKLINGYSPTFVQVIDGAIRAEYYPWELCFGIRNPSTSIYNGGYGISELEELIQIITWMLNADTYNGKFFTQGAAPKGIMKVSGSVNDARLKEFKQAWQSTTASVMNAHKIPIIQAEDWDWIDLQTKNRDMEFSQWQEYLIKVSCAIYKIDPSEVFDLQFTNKQSLSNTGKDETIKYSKTKGLGPLLRAYQTWINKYIVNPRDSELELVFVGLDIDSEMEQLDLDIKRAGSFMTLKEIREKYNLGEISEDDVVLNPTYMQWQNMKMMGSPESNQFVDEEMGGGGDSGDLWSDDEWNEIDSLFSEMREDSEKSEPTNPFVKELNDFVKKSLIK